MNYLVGYLLDFLLLTKIFCILYSLQLWDILAGTESVRPGQLDHKYNKNDLDVYDVSRAGGRAAVTAREPCEDAAGLRLREWGWEGGTAERRTFIRSDWVVVLGFEGIGQVSTDIPRVSDLFLSGIRIQEYSWSTGIRYGIRYQYVSFAKYPRIIGNRYRTPHTLEKEILKNKLQLLLFSTWTGVIYSWTGVGISVQL